MEIKKITDNKTDFMDILLIGDEDEQMINKYLEQTVIYALYDAGALRSVCALLSQDNGTIEIKNLATYPEYQNTRYASRLLDFVFNKFKNTASRIILGTGENEKTLGFYKKHGFKEFCRIKNFFIDNYSHPIFEDGKQLVDMIYLERLL